MDTLHYAGYYLRQPLYAVCKAPIGAMLALCVELRVTQVCSRTVVFVCFLLLTEVVGRLRALRIPIQDM